VPTAFWQTSGRFAFEGQRLDRRATGQLHQVTESNTPAVLLPSDFVARDVLPTDGLSRPVADQVRPPLRLSTPASQSGIPVLSASESNLSGGYGVFCTGGTLPYATGYGVDGQFVTVMATPSCFGNAARVARFSDPPVRCENLPCGVYHTDAVFGADAVRALNQVRYQIASYMPTRVPSMPGRKVGKIGGEASSARLALLVATDNGLSFAQSVSTGQSLDINTELYVEPGHVGRIARFHVLADLSAAGPDMIYKRSVPIVCSSQLNTCEF
jgi:hypothetical protein